MPACKRLAKLRGFVGYCDVVVVATVCSSSMQASAIAQQNISQIRTVAAYNREQAAMQQYDKALELPRKMVGAGLGQLAESAGAAGGDSGVRKMRIMAVDSGPNT